MHWTYAIAIVIMAVLGADSFGAPVPDAQPDRPVDFAITSMPQNDSAKTATPPPTFRVDDSQARKYNSENRSAIKRRKPGPVGKGRSITCLSLLLGVGRIAGNGAGVIISRCHNGHFASGLVAGLEFPAEGVCVTPICIQFRIYPEPDKLLYYLLTDLGADVYVENTGGGGTLGKPMCRVGLGILSNLGGPVNFFLESGCRAGYLPQNGYWRNENVFCGAGFLRAGIAF